MNSCGNCALWIPEVYSLKLCSRGPLVFDYIFPNSLSQDVLHAHNFVWSEWKYSLIGRHKHKSCWDLRESSLLPKLPPLPLRIRIKINYINHYNLFLFLFSWHFCEYVIGYHIIFFWCFMFYCLFEISNTILCLVNAHTTSKRVRTWNLHQVIIVQNPKRPFFSNFLPWPKVVTPTKYWLPRHKWPSSLFSNREPMASVLVNVVVLSLSMCQSSSKSRY